MMKTGRHHPNHDIRLVVEGDSAPQNGGIASEQALPQPVAQNDDAIRAGDGVLQPERPAEQWLRAEHAEKVRVEPIAIDGDGVP